MAAKRKPKRRVDPSKRLVDYAYEMADDARSNAALTLKHATSLCEDDSVDRDEVLAQVCEAMLFLGERQGWLNAAHDIPHVMAGREP